MNHRITSGGPAGTPSDPAISRRQFLGTVTTIAVSAELSSASAQSTQSSRDSQRSALVDTNVTVGRWPFRRLPFDDTASLAAKLRKHGVTEAWAGSFDTLFHKDLAAANARLAEECRKRGRGLLVPFGTVNPKFPGWEEDFRRCVEQHNMRGLRLHPNYHGYKLDDSDFVKLFSLASEWKLIVQIAVSMEDERMQHPLARVPHADAGPLVGLLQKFPKLPVVLLNWHRAVKPDLLKKLATSDEVFFEIATLEGVGGVANLLTQIPAQRVLFGSHAPLFYFESTQLKLKESVLSKEHDSAIRVENARKLLSPR